MPEPLSRRQLWLMTHLSPEANLQRHIMTALKDLGWDLRFHVRPGQFQRPGFLDITAINRRTGTLWVAELKGNKSRIEPEQREWMAGWHTVKRVICADIIRPIDYDAAIDQLTRLSQPRKD